MTLGAPHPILSAWGESKNGRPEDPGDVAIGLNAGLLWGPAYGGTGGYYGGRWIGAKASSNYFDRWKAHGIRAMFDDLKVSRID
jgi:hypothetical protein